MLAARERGRPLAPPVPQHRKQFETRFHVGGDLRHVFPEVGAHVEILFHREVEKNRPSLGSVSHSLSDQEIGLHAGNLCSGQDNPAARRLEHPAHRSQRAGLTRPVCADQRDHLSLAHREGDSAQGLDRSVGDVNATHLEELLARGAGSEDLSGLGLDPAVSDHRLLPRPRRALAHPAPP